MKSQTLTSPSTSHSKVLSSIATSLYDDDNGGSERSEPAKLDMPDSRIGWCFLPILESGMSSFLTVKRCPLLHSGKDAMFGAHSFESLFKIQSLLNIFAIDL